MMIARGFANRQPEFMPFGGAFGIGDLLHEVGRQATIMSELIQDSRPKQLEPPTIDLVATETDQEI